MGEPDLPTLSEPRAKDASLPEDGAVVSGEYRVVRAIGSGGMGVVVKALRLSDQRFVAMKFLRAEGSHHWNRFAREAEAARKLSGPHIARVLDSTGLAATPPYIVFELLEGSTLDELSRARGPIPAREVVALALQTCEALVEAHAAGIVHRDIKPSNLFVETRGGAPFVKVLDFGISKVEIEAGDLALTTSSTVIGSPSYASPEQLARPRAVDHRTDVWSLGVTIYKLLTAKVPFAGETAPEVHAKVLGATPPPVSALVPDVPRDLDRIVQRCLEKDPEARFPSVRDLASALASVDWGDVARTTASADASTSVGGVAAPSRRSTWFAVGGVAILLAGSFAIARVPRHRELAPAAPSAAAPLAPEPLTSAEPVASVPSAIPSAPLALELPSPAPSAAASVAPSAHASRRRSPPTKRSPSPPRAPEKAAPQADDPGDHR